jgi:hypothetical protein
VQAIRPNRPLHKALSRGGSFGKPAECPEMIFAWLVRNTERLVPELRYHEVKAGRLTVWIAYKDGEVGVGKVNLEVPADRFDLLLDAGRVCLRQAWRARAVGMRMHLIAEQLIPRASAQLGLFEGPSNHPEAIEALKETVNQRHGRYALRSAATLWLPDVYADRTQQFDICDVRGKICF